ncbi:MAG: secretin N-terminal domain-containing protein [Pirellulaceae bacterium]
MYSRLCVILFVGFTCLTISRIDAQSSPAGVDYTALATPAIAERLMLTDEQRVAAAKLLDDRINELSAAVPADRTKVLDAYNTKLAAILTDAQKEQFASIMAVGKLRFNFRQQSWPDVLEWFARQADLSLVMDSSPPGSFTYSDTKNYSAAEAIDLLNSVLLSKGFTLIRREQTLIVVELSQGIPYDLLPRVKVEQLNEHGRFEFVSVLFPLGGRPLETVVSEVTPLAGKYGQITALPSTRQLLVVETAGKIQAINALIASISEPKPPEKKPDPPKPPAPILSIYPIPLLDQEATVDTLKKLFGNATVVADPQAKQLHVFAPPDTQTAVAKALEEIAAKVSSDSQPRLEKYEVAGKDPSDIRRQLLDMFPDLQVSVDDDTNHILVMATGLQQKEVQDVLAKLGLEAATDETVQVYEVSPKAQDQTASLLSQALPDAEVVGQSGKIAVRGTATEQQLARSLIEQLEADVPVDRRPTLKFHELTRPLPESMLGILKQMFPDASVQVRNDGRLLTVTALPRDHEGIERTMQQIVTEVPVEPDRNMQIHPIPQPARSHVSVMVSELQKSMPSIRVIVGEKNAELIAWATEVEHARISVAISTLAGSGTAPADVLIAYPLRDADATQLVEMLKGLHPELTIAADTRANRVLITASLVDQARMSGIIEQLDAPKDTSQEPIVRTYPVSDTTPSLTVSLLQPLVPDLRLTADEANGRLLASGKEIDHQRLVKALEEMKSAGAGRGVVRAYKVGSADPTQVRYILVQLVPRAIVSADTTAGQVLVWANERDQQTVAEAVEQLTRGEPDESRQLKSYPIPFDLGRDSLAVFTPIAPNARFSLDDSRRLLICWGTPEEHQAIEQSLIELKEARANAPALGEQVVVYPLDREQISAELVLEALDDELKRPLSIQVNDETNSLVVRGSPTAQEQFRKAVAAVVEQLPPATVRVARVYRFKRGDVTDAMYVLREMLPDARITRDNTTRTIAATATEKEHATIATIVEQMDQPRDRSDVVTRVYRLKRASARRVHSAIEAMTESGTVDYDYESNSLVATAPIEEQNRIQEVLDQLNGPQEEEAITKVYPLKYATPSTVRQAMLDVIPDAEIAADDESGTLIVTSGTADHQRMAKLAEELDTVPGQRPIVRAYEIRNADPQAVYEAVQRGWERSRGFSVTFQEGTRTLLVTASARNHEVFTELMKTLDQATTQDATRSAKTYPLRNVDGQSAQAAVQALLDQTPPKAQVELDRLANALLVVATPEQHQSVADTLRQLDHNDRQLEVFSMQDVDPYTVSSAVYELFADAPTGTAPTVSTDYETGKLFVRGSTEQIEQIKQLLVKLGETSLLQSENRPPSGVRSIPFRGDMREALRQIETMWPKLRRNRIQVIQPGLGRFPGGEAAETGDSDRAVPAPQDPQDASPNDVDRGAMRLPENVERFVFWQDSTRPAVPRADLQDQAVKENDRRDNPADEANVVDDPGKANDVSANTRDGDGSNDAPPVVIVPQGDRITIASSDAEALDQMEELLRFLARGAGGMGRSSDMDVYLLRNTGAVDVQDILRELFKGTSSTTVGTSKVVVVADERLNALIVHGGRREREIAAELLEVLDTEDLPNPLVVYRPEMIPIKYGSASRIVEILRNVYASQLTSGGGRRPLKIPEGVSSEVAAVLQQVNAAASGPLLTLDVDEESNTIIIRAPHELRGEVRDFIASLDQEVDASTAQRVRVIQLKQNRADDVQNALEDFIRRSRRR